MDKHYGHKKCGSLLWLLFFSTTLSCQSPDGLTPKIYGGDPTSEYPAVVKLIGYGLCTGTFVSHNTLLTAAHCVKHPLGGLGPGPFAGPGPFGATVGEVRIILGNPPSEIQSIKVIHHGFIGALLGRAPNFSDRPYMDFAIAIFPKDTSADYVEVASSPPAQAGDAIKYVGFGRTSLSDNSGATAGFKNVAENVLTEITPDGKMFSKGKTGIRRGDSGGPLFRDEKLIGIASQGKGNTEDTAVSLHTNIFHPMNIKLMEFALSEGAEISGFNVTPTGQNQ